MTVRAHDSLLESWTRAHEMDVTDAESARHLHAALAINRLVEPDVSHAAPTDSDNVQIVNLKDVVLDGSANGRIGSAVFASRKPHWREPVGNRPPLKFCDMPESKADVIGGVGWGLAILACFAFIGIGGKSCARRQIS